MSKASVSLAVVNTKDKRDEDTGNIRESIGTLLSSVLQVAAPCFLWHEFSNLMDEAWLLEPSISQATHSLPFASICKYMHACIGIKGPVGMNNLVD